LEVRVIRTGNPKEQLKQIDIVKLLFGVSEQEFIEGLARGEYGDVRKVEPEIQN